MPASHICPHCGRQRNTWMRVMAALESGERTINELVRDLHLDPSGISVVLRAQCASGFVEILPGWPRRYRLSRAAA